MPAFQRLLFIAAVLSILSVFLYMNLIRNGYLGFEVYENYDSSSDANSYEVRENEKLHTLNSEDFKEFQERRLKFDSITKPVLPGEVNACILVVVDNNELGAWLPTMRSIEDRFNSKYNYTYVFLSPHPYSFHFKERVAGLTYGRLEFGRIPHKQWKIPEFIDLPEARKKIKALQKSSVADGGSLKYRFRSRYLSGYFFQHELTKKYDYYWKVDTGSEISCNLFDNDDPFVTMQNSKISYGFTISTYENMESIPSLWANVKNMSLAPSISTGTSHRNTGRTGQIGSALPFISDDSGATYNGCHFWPAMELGDFNTFRNQHYLEYFDKIDQAGGFFYERWGDGPIKTMYFSKLKSLDDLHFFDNIGFYKNPFRHCPADTERNSRCFCFSSENQDLESFSCNKKFIDLTHI